ncbi:MAG: hypothetical protein R3A51_08810 [Nannocystaceae bacterium]
MIFPSHHKMMPSLALALALSLPGCADRTSDSSTADGSDAGTTDADSDASSTSASTTSGSDATGTETSSSGSDTGTTDPTDDTTTTDAPTTTTTDEPTTTTDEPTTTTTTDEPTTTTDDSTTTTTTTGGPDDPPSGLPCVSDPDCPEDEVCFNVPLLGGVCSSCETDDDCPDGGCTFPNPLKSEGAYCNDGGPGDGCNSNAVCSDPDYDLCGTVIDVQGIITVKTCGQCLTSANCDGGQVCTIDHDIAGFTGVYECVAPGSVPLGETCVFEDGGSECASGHCAIATVMAVLQVGVCSECETDNDCGPGETCSEAQADFEMGTTIPSMCI